MNNQIESTFLGRVNFESAFKMQRQLWSLAKDKQQESIMGLEHPSVITLGRRSRKNLDILSDSEVPVVETTRGGLATLHSEGQLVIYPVLKIKDHFNGVRDFVCFLLKVTQKTFLDFDLETQIDEQQIGLYTAQGKIAFCGLEIKEGISQHGLSINISNDLSLFNQIVPCGLAQVKLDRLLNRRSDVNTRQFFECWMTHYHQTIQKIINDP